MIIMIIIKMSPVAELKHDLGGVIFNYLISYWEV